MKRLLLILILPIVLFGGLLDSLLHYYPFNSTAVDCVGSIDGTNNSGIVVSGISDSAYSFSTTAYINYNDNLDIDGYGQTISAWAKRKDLITGNQVINGRGLASYIGFAFLVYTDGSIIATYGNNTTTSSSGRKTFVSSPNIITDTDWHHIAITPYSIDSITCFVDGVKIELPYSSGGATSTVFGVALYYVGDKYQSLYTGSTDELAIFNYEVDSADVVDSLWNDGNGWFPFAAEVDTFLIDWNGIDLDLIQSINGIDIDDIQSINGIDIK